VVYEHQPTTRDNMMDRIRRVCENIPRQVLLNKVIHFQRRINLCIQANGDHVEPILNG